MKLEYRYDQTYLIDLHPGDMVPTCGGNYRIISAEDIDENGCLKTNIVQRQGLLEEGKKNE